MRVPEMRAYEGDGASWNIAIGRLPEPHLLQSWEWAQLKAQYGWKPEPHLWTSTEGQVAAAALVLKRQVLSKRLAAPLCILYVPKGPLLAWNDQQLRKTVLADLEALARREKAIFIKCDPDVLLATGPAGDTPAQQEATGAAVVSELEARGWRFSDAQVQFRNTMRLDLRRSEEQLMEQMKPKTRYNIRLATKKGVRVRAGNQDDLGLLYRMYAETSERDGFVIRNQEYYRAVWGMFMQAAGGAQPSAEALVAEVEGEPVAGILVFQFCGVAYYLYGMSREAHRERMPNYLLQWEAIRRAKKRNCMRYDLWGAPDEVREDDTMWGVYRFKQGLGGQLTRTLGAWDYASSPLWYAAYTRIVPRVLSILRRRGRTQTRQDLSMT
jgi:peptidoglycan pentaglycine glycine transferase (the first glycine)